MNLILSNAIFKLYPNVTHTIDGVAYDKDNNVVEYDKAAVEAEAAKEIK